MRLNKVQQRAVYDLYKGNPDGSASYLAFRRRVFPLFGEPAVAMIQFCGMFVGIEVDGYVHS
ncbi:MAG: hypothetical protein BGO51_15530 [Rhodospirillales bacterium 69-11]|nr:MAG: hypothetical protein BGO51_15530 [Rhodospirillales bacterium 69-11]